MITGCGGGMEDEKRPRTEGGEARLRRISQQQGGVMTRSGKGLDGRGKGKKRLCAGRGFNINSSKTQTRSSSFREGAISLRREGERKSPSQAGD